MKSKLFLMLAALFAFGALTAPKAQAGYYDSGYYVTRVVGYDRCGEPIYRRVWVENCRPRYVAPCPPVRYIAPYPRYIAPRISFGYSSSRGGYCPPPRGHYGRGGGGHRHHGGGHRRGR